VLLIVAIHGGLALVKRRLVKVLDGMVAVMVMSMILLPLEILEAHVDRGVAVLVILSSLSILNVLRALPRHDRDSEDDCRASTVPMHSVIVLDLFSRHFIVDNLFLFYNLLHI